MEQESSVILKEKGKKKKPSLMSSALASSTCHLNKAQYNGFDIVNDASKINVALKNRQDLLHFTPLYLPSLFFLGYSQLLSSKRAYFKKKVTMKEKILNLNFIIIINYYIINLNKHLTRNCSFPVKINKLPNLQL